MKKQIALILLFVSLSFGQGFYGSIGYRINQLDEPINLNYVYQGFNWLGPDYLTKIVNNNSTIVGTGYRWLATPISNNKSRNYWNLFATMSFKSFNYEGMSYGSFDEDLVSWVDWSIGTGYALKFFNGLTISADLEYNFTVLDDQISFDEMTPGNYVTLNFNLGFMQKKSSAMSHYGIFGTKILGNHFLNNSGPSMNSTQLSLESGYLGLLTGLLMILYPIVDSADETGNISNPYSKKGCHVYGKIKFVEFGEDYKVRFVSVGEDVKVKYVTLGADSPGEWQIVQIGEDYKVKVVTVGEDFTVRQVSVGQGCN